MNPHTKAWAEKIKSLDAFIFVTDEYNHSLPAALKNALDDLYAEWNNKAAGFVSYGSAGGSRAGELLRLIMGEFQVADVRNQVLLSLFNDFENYSVFKPTPMQESSLNTMLDQLVNSGTALQSVRNEIKKHDKVTCIFYSSLRLPQNMKLNNQLMNLLQNYHK